MLLNKVVIRLVKQDRIHNVGDGFGNVFGWMTMDQRGCGMRVRQENPGRGGKSFLSGSGAEKGEASFSSCHRVKGGCDDVLERFNDFFFECGGARHVHNHELLCKGGGRDIGSTQLEGLGT